MKKSKRILGVVLSSVVVVSMLGGCSGGKDTADGERKLTYWLGNSASSYVSDYNDVASLQKIQENTGIEVDFIHPSSAAWEEQFNIMLAAQDYTDLIQWNWNSSYAGGFDGVVNDGIAVVLDDYMDKLPNYSKVLKENPDFDKTLRTTDGKMVPFAALSSEVQAAAFGPMIRKDWLDKLNLEVPQTMDDWHNVLTAFKTKDPNGNGKADEIPFAEYKAGAAIAAFANAYGVKKGDVFVKNDKVVYGTVQPEFKDFVTEMNKWYKEGLIDPEFAAIEKSVTDANMTNGISGATIAYVGGSMGNYISANKNNPEYNLVSAPWPAKKAGTPAYNGNQLLRQTDGNMSTVITTGCKNIDVALEFMDYLFSEEGTILQNWGIEGETYTKENGELKFTDYVMNNEDGLSPVQAISPIAFTIWGVPAKIIDADAYTQIQYSMPAQAEAVKNWSAGDRSLMTMIWPMTAEEKERVSEIKTSISTYESEMFTKMVIGKEPISKFDSFVNELKARGVTELEAIYQKAYDRYMGK